MTLFEVVYCSNPQPKLSIICQILVQLIYFMATNNVFYKNISMKCKDKFNAQLCTFRKQSKCSVVMISEKEREREYRFLERVTFETSVQLVF